MDGNGTAMVRQWYGNGTAMDGNGTAMVPSTWYQVLVPSTWYQVLGTKYLLPSTWYQVLGTRYLVPSTGTKYLVPIDAIGLQSAAIDGNGTAMAGRQVKCVYSF